MGPSGYLQLCSTAASFTNPVDGIEQTDDSDCSDGSGVANIAHGSGGCYVVTGLNASTTYSFTLFAYSG
jgi:hypothetical protein